MTQGFFSPFVYDKDNQNKPYFRLQFLSKWMEKS